MAVLAVMASGPEQLKDWMERRGFNQRETADHFGFPEPFVSNLAQGKETPGLRRALVMERRAGIPVEAWITGLDELADVTALRRGKRRNTK